MSAAVVVRSMLGVSPSAYQDACEVMGPENAAVAVACILERAGHINNAGGYLRDLTAKARRGGVLPWTNADGSGADSCIWSEASIVMADRKALHLIAMKSVLRRWKSVPIGGHGRLGSSRTRATISSRRGGCARATYRVGPRFRAAVRVRRVEVATSVINRSSGRRGGDLLSFGSESGSSSISVIQRQHSRSHQWAGATVHCSLQHLGAVDRPSEAVGARAPANVSLSRKSRI
jgi:Replication protein C C-terminal region